MPLDASSFKKVVHGLWRDPSAKEKSKECLFRSNDIMLVYDGRNPAAFDQMSKVLTKALKGMDGIPKRNFTVCRRIFSNQCLGQKTLNPKLPDPLENLLLIFQKSFSMPFRESAISEVVANNRARGWQSLNMKTKEQQEFATVDVAKYASMCGKSGSESAAEDFEGFVELDDDDTDGPEKKQPAAAQIMLAPWENTESDYALAFELYKIGPPTQTRVVGLEGGAGTLAMMCLRKKIACTLLMNSESHKLAVFQVCLLNITVEIIMNKADGFEMKKKRVLTREGSLTGDYAPSAGSSAPTPVKAASDGTNDRNDSTPDGKVEVSSDGESSSP